MKATRIGQRDGFFDKENHFVIFNKDEINIMINALQNAMKGEW